MAQRIDILERMVIDGVLGRPEAEHVRELNAGCMPLDEALLHGANQPEERILRRLAEEFAVPYVDLDTAAPSKDFLARFPVSVLVKRRLLPLREEDGCLLVATDRLFDTTGLDALRLATGMECRPALAPGSQIERRLTRGLGIGADTVHSMVIDSGDAAGRDLGLDTEVGVDLTEEAEEASVIRFVNQVLQEAIELRATDVHLEPFERELRVRYRVDGVLQQAAIPAEVRRFQSAIVSRLKILSRLDIAEKRVPQDGRTRVRIAGREIDVRVSVIPMLHGEAVVLRLLDRAGSLLGLKELGMADDDRATFNRILQAPHGIVLVTGPTGSGKTTTLYAALSQINDVERKIVTIEDPVEYQLDGVNQIQVSAKRGLTFARGLRSILRHDPDVILVGEIRDIETAEIGVQASLTGHLVFSTLHTNDAPGAPTRLVDMGVEPYLVASSLEAVLAQRLVRTVCTACRRPLDAEDDRAARLQFGRMLPGRLFLGAGCRDCQGTGFHGRTGIFEMMQVTDDLRAHIVQRSSSGVIRKAARTQGMRSLREDGWRHLSDGRTTLQELIRVTKDERDTSPRPAAQREGG
jgi:general secretion pathway protein E/type IV pilus assembly protein PilB